MFDDDLAIIFDDPDHSVEEERFLIIGLAGIKQICLVSYCYREHGDVIRIISARKTTPKEKRIYFERIE